MKREINFRMTPKKAQENGYIIRSGYDFVLMPLEIETETLSPAAAWIAEHITATYIIDEVRDKIGISAIAGFTMAERDRRCEKSEEYIASRTYWYEDEYAKKPMRIEEITFPIYGNSFRKPEDVIESVVCQLKHAGAVKLRADNGDEFEL